VITFINPRSPFLETDGMMPPLGLFYLTAVLKKAGIKSEIIDLGLGDHIPDTDKVLITATTPQYEEALKACRPYSVLGGPHASIAGRDDKFSLTVQGEGEEVIEYIIRNMPRGHITTKRIKKLDELPFPDRSTAERYEWKICGEKATTMITSRGCNGQCAFCCKAVMDKGIFFRSPQNIADEMVHVKAMGFGAVMFYDDSLAILRNRLLELCQLITRLNMVWRCFMRSDQVDYYVVSQMAKAGCREVLLGVESGSNQILKTIKKKETVDQHKEAIRLLKKVGIKVKALMIAGLPGESWETIEESRQFILESNPDELDVTILSVYPGCDIHKNPSNYELTFAKPVHYKGKNGQYVTTVHTPYMTSVEIGAAREVLYSTWLNNH